MLQYAARVSVYYISDYQYLSSWQNSPTTNRRGAVLPKATNIIKVTHPKELSHITLQR